MALPDSQIYYPGSTVVSRSASNGSNNVNGEPVDAYVNTELNAPATESEILAWYQKTLEAAGWTYHESTDHSFNAFTHGTPGPPATELLYLDFRYLKAPPSGTEYRLTFGVATP